MVETSFHDLFMFTLSALTNVNKWNLIRKCNRSVKCPVFNLTLQIKYKIRIILTQVSSTLPCRCVLSSKLLLLLWQWICLAAMVVWLIWCVLSSEVCVLLLDGVFVPDLLCLTCCLKPATEATNPRGLWQWKWWVDDSRELCFTLFNQTAAQKFWQNSS